MLINKQLINLIGGVKLFIYMNALAQWIGLISNIVLTLTIGYFIQALYEKTSDSNMLIRLSCIFLMAVGVRFACSVLSAKLSFLSSRNVKINLRTKIYEKILELGPSYKQKINTADLIQIGGEGVEQLEVYFGKYLPQLFYSIAAPVTLFAFLSFINIPSAVTLLMCVPLIPASIIMIQRRAKKTFKKYWGAYTDLGADFLENLRGLTDLKIYQADEKKTEEMNVRAENFREATMNVLKMQLNSVTVMDLIAYGGATAGIGVAVFQTMNGNIAIGGCFVIVVLSSDFFIPLRLLGSFFHVAMNGMSAGDKILELLDIPAENKGSKEFENGDIQISGLNFSHEEGGFSLKNINMAVKSGEITSIVGESGSGKSTIASILAGRLRNYEGTVRIGGINLNDVKESEINRNITLIRHDDHIFRGNIRENLLIAKPDASDEELWGVLEQVSLKEYLLGEKGLDTAVSENASNMSGGQKQRLSLARAFLHDSPVYILDEATSNIDIENESLINKAIRDFAKEKTVLIISHRLTNVIDSNRIYVMEDGIIAEEGNHEHLLKREKIYRNLYNTQNELESYAKGMING